MPEIPDWDEQYPERREVCPDCAAPIRALRGYCLASSGAARCLREKGHGGAHLFPEPAAAPIRDNLADFKRLTHEPAMEQARRTSARLGRIQAAVVRASKGLRQPIDLNYVAIPKDEWESILAAAGGIDDARP